MLFSSNLFLYVFLSSVLALYFVVPKRYRNFLLLTASLQFYFWGELHYVQVLLGSIALNYCLGLAVEGVRPSRRRAVLVVAVTANLGLLGFFKYSGFVVDNLNGLLAVLRLPGVPRPAVHLPLGISFFTFHALSYVIDVYRGEVRALRNPVEFALYISFFPQSIAGPIIRYGDVAGQLARRTVGGAAFANGIRQFIYGLAKKMLLANTLAVPADALFRLRPEQLTCELAWLGAVCYTLQIYFDFSGYSDMAIGLARMFGFELRANFHYPYVARSVTEFWRRWHISLSSWFRDYLYIPLGGNRHGKGRTYFNLVAVFALCGLWHGANWTFVAWGLFHGGFLVLERVGLGRRLERLPSALRHAYTLLVVLVGWVFFRADHFPQAVTFLSAMAGLGRAEGPGHAAAAFLGNDGVLALAAALVCSAPALELVRRLGRGVLVASARRRWLAWGVEAALAAGSTAGLLLLLTASAMQLAASSYNPFIYFRF